MTAYTHRDVLLQPLELAILPDLLVQAGVEFGVMQANGNCVNIGICRINTTHYQDMAVARQKNRSCPFAEALLSVTLSGRLKVFFPKAGMKPCTERVFFRGPVFPVPVPYCLSETLQHSLPGLSQEIISAGLYPIRRSPEGYWIEF
ncbi:MAG: hypothetical protein IT260_08965 [Saprospiraceae bacterium]|nr:hypothetical protein [Saprospiraceae bacterium]